MLRTICFAVLFLAAGNAQSLDEKVSQLLAEPAAQRAVWGIHVVDLASGNSVYARNAGIPMTPASNTKLLSTVLSIARLGPDYRFETRILAANPPDSTGRITGDLRLVGGGDPTMSARDIPYKKGRIEGDPLKPLAELADKIVQAGVRAIDGDIIGDDTRWPWLPYPDGWTMDDTIWEYGAPVSALTINDNALDLRIRPGRKPGETAEITLTPSVEYYTIHNTLKTQAGAPRNITVDRQPNSHVLLIGGTAAPNGGAATQLIAIDDPATFAAQALAELLRARGVTIRGSVRAAHRLPGQPYQAAVGFELAKRVSPPLIEILKIVNKVSQNLDAEIVLREVGFVKKKEGTADAAHEEMTEFLMGLGLDRKDFALADGSGLSRRTLASPTTFTTVLRYMHNSPWREDFRDLLPIAGEDGTLSSRFRGFDRVTAIRAKTGSISHVAALSGYAGEDDGKRLAFSIIANNYTASSAEIRSIIDKIAVAILEEGNR
ncbi:D-alanyl-D-alanine carboxypeptidase/D-alanyl-D-alanine-endopeptidase [uncultured Paludibaculum sp.]|uniref:D-alanyl-D-alanine carboxypeptidase/D-alanyl-D-alanine endopeptidase n=1 Tax=uncultured Paludibaculum sp. TaxID=1765020 RepID=UPI002AAC4CBE|nr:D-alanyl-D-alanine carboxypeptidase/D-alanyl-D-alanine-endopeptidase [uncultured Paludibaculum sp.]